METYKLLTGETLSLGKVTEEERAFLRRLAKDAKGGADYFDLLRRVKGPKALPLRGGPITPAIAASAFYRAAHDIADRAGIEQGYLLAPDVARSAPASRADDLLSLTEAAELIGITRPAAHQALTEERLKGRRVGNAWVVGRSDAEAFRAARLSRAGDSPGPERGSAPQAGASRR